MASSKTYTWKEFERGMDKIPEEIKRLALDEVRDNMFNLSRILETVADARAYDTAPGTKASTRNTRAKGRLYGKRLAPTIMRFKNRNNPLKAYAVVGNQTWPRGGAIYAAMQLGGYRPGRPKLSAKAAVLDKFGTN